MAEAPFWPPGGFLTDLDTWTGAVDGRPWTVHGESLSAVTPTPRAVLASWLRDDLDAAVSIVDHPPQTVTAPAVVIRPADPYQAPYTAAGSAGAAWAFEVDIIVARPNPGLALELLERARVEVTEHLPPGYRWLDFGQIGELEVGKNTYLKGTLSVAMADAETGI
jgi:hypothetical protein